MIVRNLSLTAGRSAMNTRLITALSICHLFPVLKSKYRYIMLHSVLFRDADQMSANYMFLTGNQADTIARYKSEISGVFERMEKLERIATGQGDRQPVICGF